MTLTRRVGKLERASPQRDPWAPIDDVLAALPTDDLRDLILGRQARQDGRRPTAEQRRVWEGVRARVRAHGIDPGGLDR